MVTGPIGWIALAIYKNWDAIKGFLGNVWGWMKSAGSAIWNGVKAGASAVGGWCAAAWNGIKAGASQIEKTADFGFEVDQAFRALSLVALRELIDREFFVLSQAHYERYIQTPDLFAGQAE